MTEPLNVDPQALRGVATGLQDSASGLGRAVPGTALTDASASLTGLDSGAACGQIAETVGTEARGLSEAVSQYADKLDAAATAYENGDRAAAEQIDFADPGEQVPPGEEPAEPPPEGDYTPITVEELREIVPEVSQAKAEEMIGPLNAAMRDGGMNTPQRQAAFISQIAVESDRFATYEEYADGSQYEGRADLGNTQPGDGTRYKGRGLIQITGRYNYTQMSEDLGVDFVTNPELVATPEYAFASAVWYWNTHDGNAVADGGDIAAITEMVNGGHTHLAERTDYYNRGLQVLSR